MWGGLELVLSFAVCITIIVVLAGCVCGCRKDAHKSELVGTAGVVKLHIEEETPPPSQTTPLSAKRVSVQNNQRSLPEIPPPSVPRQDSGDTASELYAIVGVSPRIPEANSPVGTRRSDHPYEHAYARLQDGSLRTDNSVSVSENAVGASSVAVIIPDAIDESQSSPEGVVITASGAISGQVSSSRELPYMTPPVVVVAAAAAAASSAAVSPPATAAPTAPVAAGDNTLAPHHGTQQHFSGDSVDSTKGYTSISVREPLSSIRATLADSRQSQPHYATVSDDSDEMYAAIDEPAGSNQVYTSGSETYAQIQPTVRVQATLHHPPASAAAAPQVAPQPASTASSTQHTPTEGTNSAVTGEPSSSRRPTSDSSRQSISKHSRQASNSSCNGSVGTLGSPKPEKRQANSPLPPPPGPTDTVVVPSQPPPAVAAAAVAVAPPPPPTASHKQHKKGRVSPIHPHTKASSAKQRISSTGDLHNNPDKLRRSLNEKHQRNNSCVSSSDFYGCNYPVDKHRFSSGDLARSLVAKELNFSFDKSTPEKDVDAIYNTIDGTNDIYAAIDPDGPPKSLPTVTSSPSRNVEEMYAKVNKKSKHSQERPLSSSIQLSNHEDVESNQSSKIKEHNPPVSNIVKMRKKSLQHDDDKLFISNETKRYSGTSSTIGIQNENFRNSPSPKNIVMNNKEDPGYETIDRVRNKNHSYETIDKNVAKHKSDKNIDPGYETVKEPAKKYESQKQRKVPSIPAGGMLTPHSRHSIGIEPGYETLPSGPNSILSNDPGYEHIHRLERCPSDSDPNYEVLRPHNSTSPYASINKSQVPGYSVINKKPKIPEKDWITNNNENCNLEPNYESMPHEPGYTTGSESDPNYESVGPKDPNYESVKYFDVAMKEPPYEKVHNDSDNLVDSLRSSELQRLGSGSGYERVKPKMKHDDDQNDNRTNGVAANSGEMAPVGDYLFI